MWRPTLDALLNCSYLLRTPSLVDLGDEMAIGAAMLDFFVGSEDLTSDYFTHRAIPVYKSSSVLNKQCSHPDL